MKVRMTQEAPDIVMARAGESLLVFEDAVLARAEVNANGDELTLAAIGELAQTIPLKPLDADHETRSVIGFFTKGHQDNDALIVDGVVFADRFPEQAKGIRDGTLHLSMEAEFHSATCSICGGEFTSAAAYCEHLRNRKKSGARRKLSGLRAIGGGTTPNPAGTGTRFAPNQMYFVASADADSPAAHFEVVEAETEAVAQKQEGDDDMATIEELQASVTDYIEKLRVANEERVGLAAKVAEFETALAEAEAQIATLTASAAASEAATAKFVELVKAGIPVDEVAALPLDKLAATDDTVIAFMVAQATKAPAAPPVAAPPAAQVVASEEISVGDERAEDAPLDWSAISLVAEQ